MNEAEVVKKVTWCNCADCGGCSPSGCHLDSDDGIGWCCPCCDECLEEQGVPVQKRQYEGPKNAKSPFKRYSGLKPASMQVNVKKGRKSGK
jgi:hypothetical protein